MRVPCKEGNLGLVGEGFCPSPRAMLWAGMALAIPVVWWNQAAKPWYLWPPGSLPISFPWPICFDLPPLHSPSPSALPLEGASGITVNVLDLFWSPPAPLRMLKPW